MRQGFVSRLLVGSAFGLVADAAACNPLAVSLPFKSNVLANRVEVRGVQWQVGGPSAQTIALLPSASYNDTYIYGASNLLCQQPVPNSSPQKYNNFSIEECTTFRGGLYSTDLSTTEIVGTSMKHPFDSANASWTTDNVTITDGANKDIGLSQLSFGIRASTSHPYVNKGELGLGSDSTFLSTLASGKKIASKTYSFFWGTDSTISDTPRNGSLTLGGYDQALVGDSPNTTTAFTHSQWKCREGMVVELTGIDLHSVTGTTQSVIGSEKLEACVVPTLSSILTLPYTYWDKMHDMLGIEQTPFNNGSSGELFYGVASVKPSTATFKGNLSITLNNEITITIPNEQFIFDEPYTASNGQIRRNTDWKNIPIVSYIDLDQNMPRIGGMFLSSAYLMVNHDKNEFTIAPVQKQPAAQKLIGIDTENSCIAAVEGGATTVPPSSGTTNATVEAGVSIKLSGGAIAGITVGVLALLAIVAGIAFVSRRRKRSPGLAKIEELEAPYIMRGSIAEKHGYSTTEMPAGPYAGEMSGDERDLAVELDGNSRPTEVPAHGYEAERLISERR